MHTLPRWERTAAPVGAWAPDRQAREGAAGIDDVDEYLARDPWEQRGCHRLDLLIGMVWWGGQEEDVRPLQGLRDGGHGGQRLSRQDRLILLGARVAAA